MVDGTPRYFVPVIPASLNKTDSHRGRDWRACLVVLQWLCTVRRGLSRQQKGERRIVTVAGKCWCLVGQFVLHVRWEVWDWRGIDFGGGTTGERNEIGGDLESTRRFSLISWINRGERGKIFMSGLCWHHQRKTILYCSRNVEGIKW